LGPDKFPLRSPNTQKCINDPSTVRHIFRHETFGRRDGHEAPSLGLSLKGELKWPKALSCLTINFDDFHIQYWIFSTKVDVTSSNGKQEH